MRNAGAGTADLPGTRRGATGRQNNDGTEETIKIQPIKDAVAGLMKRFRKAEDARQDYKDETKVVAERSGVNVSTLNKLIKSSYKGNYADVRREIDQQSVVFESVGEVPGGKETGE